MNFRIKCNRMLILLALLLRSVSIYAKGGGAGEEGSGGSTYTSGSSGSSGSRTYSSGWVFFYGNGDCGQYCIITFSIVGVLILLIILCGIWRCCLIKRYYKKEKMRTRMGFEQDMTELGISDNIPRPNSRQNAVDQQYPSLSNAQRIYDLPPSYNEVPAAPEPSYLHGLRHNATWQAYKEGQKFNRENPPYEVLPPADHVEYIRASGGPKAWEVRLEESIRNSNLVTVSDNGRVVQFNGRYDKMVQTNYPFFRPYEDDSYGEVSPTSVTGLRPSMHVAKEGSSTPLREDWFYYYEINVLSNPKKKDTTIAMGLATKPYPPFRLPGWHRESVGWHSDDGRKFHNESYGGRDYSEMWGEVGDTIGCGYYPRTGIVFFTKNGQRLDNAFSGLRHIWFPTVGASDECEIEFNFGYGEKEFRYVEARGTSVAGPTKTSSNASTNSLGEFHGDTNYRKEG